MICALIEVSTIPEILQDAFDDGYFDPHCFMDKKFKEDLANSISKSIESYFDEN